MSKLIVIIVAISVLSMLWFIQTTTMIRYDALDTEEGVMEIYEPNILSTPEYDTPSTRKGNEIFRLVNETRLRYGQTPLTYSSELDIAANNKANDMYERDYFSHTGSDEERFDTFITETGLEPGLVGENLARKFSVPKAYRAWLNSPSHLDNIIESRYTKIGVGVSQDNLMVIMFWGPLR